MNCVDLTVENGIDAAVDGVTAVDAWVAGLYSYLAADAILRLIMMSG